LNMRQLQPLAEGAVRVFQACVLARQQGKREVAQCSRETACHRPEELSMPGALMHQ
jgi:hypothetical protein